LTRTVSLTANRYSLFDCFVFGRSAGTILLSDGHGNASVHVSDLDLAVAAPFASTIEKSTMLRVFGRDLSSRRTQRSGAIINGGRLPVTLPFKSTWLRRRRLFLGASWDWRTIIPALSGNRMLSWRTALCGRL
jgi:hypothetical protein